MINELKNSLSPYYSKIKISEVCIGTYKKLNKIGNTNIPYLNTRVSLVAWTVFVLAMGVSMGALASYNEPNSLKDRISPLKDKNDKNDNKEKGKPDLGTENSTSNGKTSARNNTFIEDEKPLPNFNDITNGNNSNINNQSNQNQIINKNDEIPSFSSLVQPPLAPPPPAPPPLGSKINFKNICFPDQKINETNVSEPEQPEISLKIPSEDSDTRNADGQKIKKFISDLKGFLGHIEPKIKQINSNIDEMNNLKKEAENINILVSEINSKKEYILKNTKDGKISLTHVDGQFTHDLDYYTDEKFEEEKLKDDFKHFKISKLINSYDLEIERLKSIPNSKEILQENISKINDFDMEIDQINKLFNSKNEVLRTWVNIHRERYEKYESYIKLKNNVKNNNKNNISSNIINNKNNNKSVNFEFKARSEAIYADIVYPF